MTDRPSRATQAACSGNTEKQRHMIADKNDDGPEIRVFRSIERGPIPFDGEMLDLKLPFSRPADGEGSVSVVTYRDYLAAIRAFLLENFDDLRTAIRERVPECGDRIDRIDIIAEKHGSDYHPAGVTVYSGDSSVRFAVNVALTERGRTRLNGEFRTLSLLWTKYRSDYAPRVHFIGEASVGNGGPAPVAARMFLADWLDGFHEFHLSEGEGVGAGNAVLWDFNKGFSVLSEEEMREIHRQAAFILTYFYDSRSFEEIFPWHHAAGDFVVSRTPKGIRVKLIAARQYASRIPVDDDGSSDEPTALLLFLANLTVRMRLDRVDGTGGIVWAADPCVESTVRGFMEAMKGKVDAGVCDRTLFDELPARLKALSPGEAAGFFAAVADSYDEDAPDVPVVFEHLADHIFEFYRVAQEFASA